MWGSPADTWLHRSPSVGGAVATQAAVDTAMVDDFQCFSFHLFIVKQ
jgi:hypothetical protein